MYGFFIENPYRSMVFMYFSIAGSVEKYIKDLSFIDAEESSGLNSVGNSMVKCGLFGIFSKGNVSDTCSTRDVTLTGSI